MPLQLLVLITSAVSSFVALSLVAPNCFAAEDGIRPYAANPQFWQYKGQPVLLLGGSKDDSLYQLPDLQEHLDEVKAAGANFVRNTMSPRQDHGYELYPHARRDDGKYDLNEWNDAYWQKLKNLLDWTLERDIIVQIEVWDRFDYSQDHWAASPWRPANNVNYTGEESGLDDAYAQPAYRDKQPFFHSIPGMPMFDAKLDVVRGYQEQLVAKMLTYSLDYPNVLYCMNNETSTPPAWGLHWMHFIRAKAKEKGVDVYVTDMFDDVWNPEKSAKLRRAFDSPNEYMFIDVSQVNSRTFNEEQGRRMKWIADQMAAHPRPLNHVKIYSDGNYNFGTGTPVDGVERFWRNLIFGSAAVRFHRPDAGIGLNDIAKACIRSARLVESKVKFWDVAAHQELLSNREEDEAYLAAKPGEAYVLYFTDGGEVGLDLSGVEGAFSLAWVDVAKGAWGGEAVVQGGSVVDTKAPGGGGWVAVITRE